MEFLKGKNAIDKAVITGILLGVLYGVALRMLFETRTLVDRYTTVSWAFVLLMPIVMGAIVVKVASKVRYITRFEQVFWPWASTIALLLTLIVLLFEGVICVVIVLPAFLAFASLGGLIQGSFQDKPKADEQVLRSLLLLPLILSPIELSLLKPDLVARKVETSVVINAPDTEIWAQLTNVKEIGPDELKPALIYFMGIPKPLEAKMSGAGTDRIRTSYWEKGVIFKERITHWQAPSKLAYDFEIDPNGISLEALDQHVTLNGRYLKIINGGYEVVALDKGRCRVTLNTSYRNDSTLQLYGNLWADFILNDFHGVLLDLIKRRSEKPA